MRTALAQVTRILIGVALGLAPVVSSPVSAQELAADEQAVHDVLVLFHGALSSGDSATVADLLADGAVILESGGVETREDYLGGHMRADMAYEQSVNREQTSTHIRIDGTTAWGASTSHNTGESRGREIDSNSAELMVLTRTPEGWRIHAIHWSSRANQE